MRLWAWWVQTAESKLTIETRGGRFQSSEAGQLVEQLADIRPLITFPILHYNAAMGFSGSVGNVIVRT